MKILGFQKLSLIDYPGKIACIIFLSGCNFRCGFCHNPELVIPKKNSDFFSEQKILFFLKERKKYLDAVCITGGEPLINPDLLSFLFKIKKEGYLIKIDTNGENPELLKKIIEEKLVDYIAMDIKSDKENYDLVSGVKVNLKKIEESIKLILNSNLEYEFRTTVVKKFHNTEKMKKIAIWLNEFSKPKRFCIQNFISKKGKILNKDFEQIPCFTQQELNQMANEIFSYFDDVKIRN